MAFIGRAIEATAAPGAPHSSGKRKGRSKIQDGKAPPPALLSARYLLLAVLPAIGRCQTTATLTPRGQTPTSGQSYSVGGGAAILIMQADGNLVYYVGGTGIWYVVPDASSTNSQ
jgi:hypothetical protein